MIRKLSIFISKKFIFSLCVGGLLSFGAAAQTVIFEDSFEDYEDFTIEDFGEWTQYDFDGGITWGVEELPSYPNEGYVGSGIIFNASAIGADPDYYGNTGDKALFFFASGASGSNYPNDDWTVSPLISLDGVTNAKLSLYAKALTDLYGPDQFEIGVSTTGNDPSSDEFEIISNMINPEAGFYEEYEFDLSAYDGQDIHIGIHCTTDDGLLLMIDDFLVTGESVVGVEDFKYETVGIYPNPVSDILNLNLTSKFDLNSLNVTVTDMAGKVVKNTKTGVSIDMSDIAQGVYTIKVTDGKHIAVNKFIKQ